MLLRHSLIKEILKHEKIPILEVMKYTVNWSSTEVETNHFFAEAVNPPLSAVSSCLIYGILK